MSREFKELEEEDINLLDKKFNDLKFLHNSTLEEKTIYANQVQEDEEKKKHLGEFNQAIGEVFYKQMFGEE